MKSKTHNGGIKINYESTPTNQRTNTTNTRHYIIHTNATTACINQVQMGIPASVCTPAALPAIMVVSGDDTCSDFSDRAVASYAAKNTPTPHLALHTYMLTNKTRRLFKQSNRNNKNRTN